MHSRESARSSSAMVSTPHPLATTAGVETLQAGGSAIDAAIAANAVLGVTMVDQCGLGGDLFALVYDPHSKTVSGINGSGASPLLANIEEMHKQGIMRMPMQGALSVTVPGTVDAWHELSQHWGKLPWKELFQPAIKFASKGFEVNQQLSHHISLNAKLLSLIPQAENLYSPQGKPIQPGQLLVQPALAKLLENIGSNGRDVFYQGDCASNISRKVEQNGGLLQAKDLSSHRSEWVKPISVPYRDTMVFALPPNAPGILLLSILTSLNLIDLLPLGYQSADFIQFVLESVQKTLREGMHLIADPRFVNSGWDNWLNGELTGSSLNKLAGSTPLRGDTISLCIVDKDGLGISMIQSIYHDFGSGIYVDELGLFLQNCGASFSLDINDNNCLAPGKRPAHTLCPALICNENGLLLVVGTRGGNGQPQTLAQVISGILDFGLDPQTVLDSPRWVWGSTTAAHRTDGLVIEDSFALPTINTLQQRGIPLQVTSSPSVSWMGCAQMILVDQHQGQKLGAADIRGGGLALGY